MGAVTEVERVVEEVGCGGAGKGKGQCVLRMYFYGNPYPIWSLGFFNAAGNSSGNIKTMIFIQVLGRGSILIHRYPADY